MTRIGWLLLAPSLLGAAWLALLGSGMVFPPVNGIETGPQDTSFVMALVANDPERAYGFLRTGQDPNQSVPFRHTVLTANRELRVPPLMIALATGSDNAAMMLLSSGAELALPQHQGAACLAEWAGASEAAALIRRGGKQPCTCPARPGDGALVIPFARPGPPGSGGPSPSGRADGAPSPTPGS